MDSSSTLFPPKGNVSEKKEETKKGNKDTCWTSCFQQKEDEENPSESKKMRIDIRYQTDSDAQTDDSKDSDQ